MRPRVLRAFELHPDRIALVHGRDGTPHDGGFGTHCVIHARWANALGYFVPPHFSSDYNDTWLNELANQLGRRVYVPEILTEHMHYSVSKAEMDENTRDRLRRHAADSVDALYASLAARRAEDLAKLRAVIADHETKAQ